MHTGGAALCNYFPVGRFSRNVKECCHLAYLIMATIVLFFQFYIQKCPVGKTFIGHSWILLQFRDLKYTIETALEGVHSLIISACVRESRQTWYCLEPGWWNGRQLKAELELVSGCRQRREGPGRFLSNTHEHWEVVAVVDAIYVVQDGSSHTDKKKMQSSKRTCVFTSKSCKKERTYSQEK